jgi:hypothetical protein
MAIEEARKIRETVSSSGAPAAGAAGTAGAAADPSGAADAGAAGADSTPPIPSPGSTLSQSDMGKGAGYGTTLGG